jgi:endonuclease/exonuclease/phosphatase family metal-dependent hydrolase
MFRLLTYNIMHGGHGRLEALARVITDCAPDLVLLQEATDPALVERLAEATGMADWRAFKGQSLGFLSRRPTAFSEWVRPRISRHAFVQVVPEGEQLRVFGVHLSAVHAAWTEHRRVLELRALLRSIARHQDGFHALAGDFNTIAPGDFLRTTALPMRLRPLVWMSGGRIRWRTVQTVLDAGYVDAFRLLHPADPGLTLPTPNPHVRLDYVFVPKPHIQRLVSCEVLRSSPTVAASDHFPVLTAFDLDSPRA